MRKWFPIWLALLCLSITTEPVCAADDPPAAEKKLVHVYFADKSREHLSAEDRVVPDTGDPVDLGKQVIMALLQGPRGNLVGTIPGGTRLNALFIAGDGTGYIDLSKAVTENHPGGVRSEMMTIYSIVNSLVLNVEQIKTVKIMIDGGEAWTLAGHVDIRFPFPAEMLLIR
jgi:spore germination protein GerM